MQGNQGRGRAASKGGKNKNKNKNKGVTADDRDTHTNIKVVTQEAAVKSEQYIQESTAKVAQMWDEP